MKILYKVFALLLAISLAIGIPVAAAASSEQVCSGLSSGKIDVSGEPASLTLTAPAGTLIDGYCVKAGSANQEDGGPVYVDLVTPAPSVTIAHPTGKGISHYSFSTTPIVVVEPTVTPTTPAPEPTVVPTTPAPEPTVVPTTPAPTVEPTPSVEPTTPAPTEPPCDSYSGGCPTPVPTEEPEPSTSPTPVACPDSSFVGNFSNTSGQTATLVVAVNGYTVAYGVEPNSGPVIEDDYQVPTGTSGSVYLYGAEVGDAVHLYLGLPRDNGSDFGVIGPDCKLDLEVTVGPSGPGVPKPRPSEPHESCPRPYKDALNRILCPDEDFVGPVVPPTKPSESPAPFVGPKAPGKVVPNTVSDGRTVDIAEELPYTGSQDLALLAYFALMLVGLGILCYTLPVAFDTRRVA